jgi:hypothetical protein
MVDDVHVDRHPVALDEQLGYEGRRDGWRRRHPLRIAGPFAGEGTVRSKGGNEYLVDQSNGSGAAGPVGAIPILVGARR